MKTALAILRKDLRRLWPYALVLAALLALAGIERRSFYLQLALPPACWLIIVAGIHQERLTGDRQYWVTRPITWKHLLVSKILLVLVFVNLPVALYHSIVWMALGIPPLQHLSALLRVEGYITAWYILPAAAIAAITGTFGQTVFAALLACAGWALANGVRYSLEWAAVQSSRLAAPAIIFVVGSSAVLLLQYSRRRTVMARLTAALTVALLIAVSLSVPMERVFARPLTSSPVRITFDSSRPALWLDSSQWAGVQIPVRIEGLPAGTELFVAGVRASATGPGLRSNAGYVPRLENDRLHVDFWPWAAEAITQGRLDVQGVAELVAFRRTGTARLPQSGRVVVPHAGVCSAQPVRAEFRIVCSTPPGRAALFVESQSGGSNWIVPLGFAAAPLSAMDLFQPVEKHSSQLPYPDRAALTGVRLVAAEPIGHYEVSFRFKDLRYRRPRLGEWR
jgi:hypothetical protein